MPNCQLCQLKKTLQLLGGHTVETRFYGRFCALLDNKSKDYLCKTMIYLF